MAPRQSKQVDADQSDLIDVGDLPIPETDKGGSAVEDEFKHHVSCQSAFLGIGQCGNRLVEEFWNVGYRRVAALNTTDLDLKFLNIPEANKLSLGSGGAGKRPEVAADAFRGRESDLLDFLHKTWGRSNLDRVMVCFGLGGGTGAGIWPGAVETIRKWLTDERSSAKLGAIIALPRNDEGVTAARNACYVLAQLEQSNLTPLLMIDNERVRRLYPSATVETFWPVANKSTIRLFHLFNRLSGSPSQYKPLDSTDFAHCLDAGTAVMGMTVMHKYKTESDIATVVREHLRTNLLADVDLETGKVAACAFVGSPKVFSSLPQEFLSYAQQALSRLLAPNAVIHSATYPGAQDDLRCYLMVGGLTLAGARIQELRRLANYPPISGLEVQE